MIPLELLMTTIEKIYHKQKRFVEYVNKYHNVKQDDEITIELLNRHSNVEDTIVIRTCCKPSCDAIMEVYNIIVYKTWWNIVYAMRYNETTAQSLVDISEAEYPLYLSKYIDVYVHKAVKYAESVIKSYNIRHPAFMELNSELVQSFKEKIALLTNTAELKPAEQLFLDIQSFRNNKEKWLKG